MRQMGPSPKVVGNSYEMVQETLLHQKVSAMQQCRGRQGWAAVVCLHMFVL